MKQQWKRYLFWVILSEAVGVFASFLIRDSIIRFGQTAARPSFTPPDAVFPIVWTVLYALMGISAARIWLYAPKGEKQTGLNLFFAQLIFQFFWTLIFFNAGAYGLALFWIIILWWLILFMILSFSTVDRTAAILQIPYFLWVTFAAVLNTAVWLLNR